jgi:hypothetical protein
VTGGLAGLNTRPARPRLALSASPQLTQPPPTHTPPRPLSAWSAPSRSTTSAARWGAPLGARGQRGGGWLVWSRPALLARLGLLGGGGGGARGGRKRGAGGGGERVQGGGGAGAAPRRAAARSRGRAGGALAPKSLTAGARAPPPPARQVNALTSALSLRSREARAGTEAHRAALGAAALARALEEGRPLARELRVGQMGQQGPPGGGRLLPPAHAPACALAWPAAAPLSRPPPEAPTNPHAPTHPNPAHPSSRAAGGLPRRPLVTPLRPRRHPHLRPTHPTTHPTPQPTPTGAAERLPRRRPGGRGGGLHPAGRGGGGCGKGGRGKGGQGARCRRQRRVGRGPANGAYPDPPLSQKPCPPGLPTRAELEERFEKVAR